MNFVLSKVKRWHWKNNSSSKGGVEKVTPQESYSRKYGIFLCVVCNLLLLTWSVACVACRGCHSSGTFFPMWFTHMLVFHEGAGGWGSEVFVSPDARRACSRGVVGGAVGAYPRGTGSSPVGGGGGGGEWALFPLMLSALSFVFLWHTHTHTHTHTLSFSLSL